MANGTLDVVTQLSRNVTNPVYNNGVPFVHMNSTQSIVPSIASNYSSMDTNPRLVNGVINLLFMIFNLAGNSLVLFVYHSLFRNTVFNLFVKALASLDLLTAMTTMLMDVIMKMKENSDDSYNIPIMCKLSHFQVYANSMASGCVLTLIAYQRYRKICHPLQRGMQIRKAKILLVVIGGVCLLISSPTLALYGPRKINVLVGNDIVETTICRANNQNSLLIQIFQYLLMAVFCVVLVSTGVLYFMVSRSIRLFEKRSSAALNPINSLTASPEPHEATDIWDDRQQYHHSPLTTKSVLSSPVNGRPVINDPYRTRRTSPHQSHFQQQATPKKRDSLSTLNRLSTISGTSVISAQMYRIFSIITFVFVISYLPHLVALILTKTLKLDDEILTQAERIALELAYNCPYIATVSNPIIYGFSSSEFRDRIRDMLQSCDVCCCCCLCDCECVPLCCDEDD